MPFDLAIGNKRKDKLGFKITNFCASMDTVNRMKRQPMGWEEIIAHHTSGKGLRSRIHIYKELLQLTIKKQKPIEKQGKDLNKHFSPEDETNDQQAHEKMLSITNHQENTSENYNEISLHTHWDGVKKKKEK